MMEDNNNKFEITELNNDNNNNNNNGNNNSEYTIQEVRQLTNEEIAKLLSDTVTISLFRQQKLEKDAKKNWDLFYKRNLNKFFRDRNWTIREFEELFQFQSDMMNDNELQPLKSKRRLNLLEAGCGVGNFVWPLIKMGLEYNYYACDFSPVALEIFKNNELYNEDICHVFQADLTEPNSLISKMGNNRFQLVSLIFVLSAIHPDKMKIALQNIYEVFY